MSTEFVTDAQGYDLIKREVYNDSDFAHPEALPFASSFYPVDSFISVSN